MDGMMIGRAAFVHRPGANMAASRFGRREGRTAEIQRHGGIFLARKARLRTVSVSLCLGGFLALAGPDAAAYRENIPAGADCAIEPDHHRAVQPPGGARQAHDPINALPIEFADIVRNRGPIPIKQSHRPCRLRT